MIKVSNEISSFANFALNDVTLRHTAHSIGVVLTVFRFFSFLASIRFFLPLTRVAMHFPSFSIFLPVASFGVLVHESFLWYESAY